MVNERYAKDIAEKTYAKRGGLFWISNDAPVPLFVFEEAGVTPTRWQAGLIEEHDREFLMGYVAFRKENGYTAEERAEGKGMVDVLTGVRL